MPHRAGAGQRAESVMVLQEGATAAQADDDSDDTHTVAVQVRPRTYPQECSPPCRLKARFNACDNAST